MMGDFVAKDHLARFVLSLVRDDLGLGEITLRCGDLVCVGPTDRGQVGCIVDPSLEEGNLAVKFRAVDGECLVGYAKIAEAGLIKKAPDRPDCEWLEWTVFSVPSTSCNRRSSRTANH
jgi:hypothetical protein